MLFASITPNLIVAAFVMVAVGFFSINFNTLSNSILQVSSMPEMRGRVLSLWSIAFLGTTPIGGPIIGWIGDQYGPRWGLVVGGAAAILAALLVYFLRKKDKDSLIPIEVSSEQTIAERTAGLK